MLKKSDFTEDVSKKEELLQKKEEAQSLTKATIEGMRSVEEVVSFLGSLIPFTKSKGLKI